MKFYILIFAILYVVSCSNQSNTDYRTVKKDSLAYSGVEVYCWCFLHDRALEKKTGLFSYELEGCNPPASVPPYRLIIPQRLFYSTSNPDSIQALTKLFFLKKDSVGRFSGNYPDSRLVLLFRRNQKDADTLVNEFRAYEGRKFYFNSKNVFYYSFQILDSLTKTLNKTEINCRQKR